MVLVSPGQDFIGAGIFIPPLIVISEILKGCVCARWCAILKFWIENEEYSKGISWVEYIAIAYASRGESFPSSLIFDTNRIRWSLAVTHRINCDCLSLYQMFTSHGKRSIQAPTPCPSHFFVFIVPTNDPNKQYFFFVQNKTIIAFASEKNSQNRTGRCTHRGHSHNIPENPKAKTKNSHYKSDNLIKLSHQKLYTSSVVAFIRIEIMAIRSRSFHY